MSATLRPCPFCGGDAAFGTTTYGSTTVQEQGWSQDTFHFVNCIRCGAANAMRATGGGYDTQEIAAERWNRRAEGRQ